MHFNIKAKMLLEMIEIHIVSTQKRMRILLHFWTTYRWIENHCVLSIVVTSLAITTTKNAITNVIFIASNKTTCITFAILHPHESI
jgi:hypothetical protein